jgi:O-antigen/teichoic acid export membrane protein
MRSIITITLTRLMTMVPTAIATVLSTRLVLGRFDAETFNAFTVVFAVMMMIPLSDLGVGAALTTAVAENGVHHPRTQQTALTAARILATSGIVLAVGALLFSGFGLWPGILGHGTLATNAYGLTLVLYAMSFVPGLAQSALLGINRADLTILVQASLAPAMAAGVGVCAMLDAPAWSVVLAPGIAILAVSLLNAYVGSTVSGLRLLPLVPRLLDRKRFPGTKISAMAGPALIVSLTTPITLQGQRFVMSHINTAEDVAKFSVSIQVFMPLFFLIPAAASPLWPLFARQRVSGVKTVSLSKILLLFALGTTLAAGATLALADPIASFVTGGEVNLGLAMPALVAAGTVLLSVSMPVSMAMMYPAGLKRIAQLALIATPLNLIGSIVAAEHIGPLGPLWVSGFTSLFVQTVPCLVFLARNQPTGPAAEVDLGAEVEQRAEDTSTGIAPEAELPLDEAPPIDSSVLVAEVTAGADLFGGHMVGRWRESSDGRSW